MGKLESVVQITGTLDNLSFFTRAGSDKIIVRLKGGPSREKVLTAPNFERTRENASEFAGRVLASQMIRRTISAMSGIFNYNVTVALHKPLRALQVLDTTSPRGQRTVIFSRKPAFLEGLNFNSRASLDSVVRTPIECTLSAEGKAEVFIPELIPDLNLILPEKYPYYRFVVGVGVVPDLVYKDGKYVSAVPGMRLSTQTRHETSWVSVRSRSEATTMSLTHPPVPRSKDCVWILSVGIELGALSEWGDIMPVKRQGAGKILKCLVPDF